MRTRLLLTAALALPFTVAGCDDTTDDTATPEASGVTAMKQALPSAEAMTIDLPSGNFQVAQQATFYAFTWGITTSVNGFVRNISNVVEDIVELPPTETDGATYAVWGPWTEPLSPATWRVRVDAVGDGFDYVVQAWPKEADESAAVDVLRGQHTPRPGARRGVGAWTYDLTAARSVDPIAHDALGTIEVAYDLADTRSLEVTFTEVQGPHDPLATSTLYRYTEAADRAGTFDFVSNLDIHADDDPTLDRRELLQVRARWLPTGPGRADVLATHGDLPAGATADLVECWGDAFTRSYAHFAYGEWSSEEGDATACPYADRELPAFADFDPDAFADAELVEALPQIDELEPPVAPVADPVAETAIYYRVATNIIAGLGDQVAGVLSIVTNVTRNPPNACDARGCVWGPWTDWATRTSFLVTVGRTETEGLFGYRAQVKQFAADAEWQTLVEGAYVESADGGQGGFVFDYDVLASFQPLAYTGRFRAEYARMGEQGALNVRFDQVAEGENAPMDARYFVAHGPQGGLLDLAIATDIDDGNPERAAVEDLEARVRWATGVGGVANALASGGDLQDGTTVVAVECWDARAAQTHFDFALQPAGADTLPDTMGPGCVATDWQPPEFPPLSDERDAE